MTDKQLAFAMREAPRYSDPDAYVSDLILSSAFLPEAPDTEPDISQADALRTVWHVVRDPFRDLLELLGLGQSELADRYCIPLRTVQNWARGVSPCAAYLRVMLARLAGLL